MPNSGTPLIRNGFTEFAACLRHLLRFGSFRLHRGKYAAENGTEQRLI